LTYPTNAEDSPDVTRASTLALTLALFFLTISSFPRSSRVVSSTIVISEFRTRGSNGGNDEFIELYNLSASPVNIGGWKIRGSSGTSGTGNRVTIASGVTLQAGCHYLVTNSGYSGGAPGDQNYGTGISDNGGIALTKPDGTIMDQVGLSAGSLSLMWYMSILSLPCRRVITIPRW
jgi:uncharacterized protein